MTSCAVEELLPLVPEETKFNKSNSIFFKLQVEPADPNSATYKKCMPILSGTEGIRAAINFCREMPHVVEGVNAHGNYKQANNMIERVLKNTALTTYQSGVAASRALRLI